MKKILFAFIVFMAMLEGVSFATKFPIVHNQEIKESAYKGEIRFNVKTISQFYKELCTKAEMLEEEETLFLEWGCFSEEEWKELEGYFLKNQNFEMVIYRPGMYMPAHYNWIEEMARYYDWKTPKVIIWKL